MSLTVLEICTGGGGQALGLEMAGFDLAAAVEIDKDSCNTLRLNRPKWTVIEGDVADLDGRKFRGIDLFAGGVPCPPFSIAGKQLGHNDERDLFPQALRLIAESQPRAVLLENVRGFASDKFSDYRKKLLQKIKRLGYVADWRILNASSFGVPQLRPRFVLVALRPEDAEGFAWPETNGETVTVGETIGDLMAVGGWKGAKKWARKANRIAPTLVGGSKKHGGPDLGPTRARAEWAKLGVDGLGIADAPPSKDLSVLKMPRLTVQMTARIQGFPDKWKFYGRKTTAYRQVGNAFPPPVAKAIGLSIIKAFSTSKKKEAKPKHQQVKIPTYV